MGADNYENLGFQVKVDGATDAVNHLQNIIDRLERINQLQGKKISVSKQVINSQKQEEKQLKRNTQSLTSYLGKLTSTVVIAKKFARVISSAIQESANYVENLNLFAVAYGDVYQDTLKWALELADGFGLASNEVLKFAGTFRQLSTSLGLIEDTANSVSKTVTQLGYDISALFNTSVENAMEKLQSSLFSGNVRPLRAYGIDISQNQIDALFATNEALSSLGVNARNLSQSDKVLARLIITLRDGSNAFGTMNREINTLQSQIRILQGSFSNFKLAIGDLVQEPVKQALTYLNTFIIAMTSVIRAFHPLKTEDENNIFNGVAMGAEEANEAIDELNGKLADFDKFNVLGGQSQGGGNLAVTEALTAELKKQQEIYQAQIDAMSKIKNEAVEMSKGIVGWFIEVDEEGNILYKDDMPIWTNNAKALALAFGALATINILGKGGSGGLFDNLSFAILECATSTKGLTTQTTLLGKAFTFIQTHPIIAIIGVVVALLGALYATNEEFRNSINGLISSLAPLLSLAVDLIGQVLKPIIPLLSGLANILAGVLSFVVKVATGIIYVVDVIVGVLLSPIELVIKGISTILVLLETLFNWNWSALGEKLSKLWSNWAIGDIIVGGSQGLATTVRGYADGGYSNANLIMTHENGKREAIMKQGKSNVIMNDMQMTDIMELAVAKGVYNALSARSAMGGNVPTNETIVVKIGEEAVFNAVRKTARRQGRDFANV